MLGVCKLLGLSLALLSVAVCGVESSSQSPQVTSQPSAPVVEPERQSFVVRGMTVEYSVYGEGPTCLAFSLSFSIGSDLMRPVLRDAGLGMQRVVVDLPGCGGSADPPAEFQYSLDELAFVLEECRKKIGVAKVWLLAHDDAGLIAIRYARTFPDHCFGLILVGTCPDYSEQRREERAREHFMRLRRGAADAGDALNDMWMSRTDAQLKESFIRAAVEFTWSEEAAGKLRKLCDKSRFNNRAWERIWTAANRWDVSNDLPSLSLPVLLIASTSNIMSPLREVEKVHLRIAGSKFLITEDAGLFPWLDSERRFTHCLRAGIDALQVAR